jgi:hypothetical protein
MAITPSYGWVTPAPTDFVTDLPADFETFADAVDASFTAAEGDLLVGGTTNIFEPLTIGAAGTVLTSDGDTAEWAAPAGGAPSFSLLSTTTLSGTSVTISSIPAHRTLYVVLKDVRVSNIFNSRLLLRLNGDTGNNYRASFLRLGIPAAYTTTQFDTFSFDTNQFSLGQTNNNAAGKIHGGFMIHAADTSGTKPFTSTAGGTRDPIGTDINNAQWEWHHSMYLGTSAISSMNFRMENSATFNLGDVLIYGSED